jgi:copper(I)-binding protein
MRRLRVALVLLLASGGALHAADWKVGDLNIAQPWSRATAPGATTGVIYFGIANAGKSDDRLTGISTDVADKAELHKTMMMPGDAKGGGMMMMDPMPDGVAIAAGQSVTLRPDGMHVMLMGLKRQLKPGDTFPVTLTFEKAGKVDATAEVGGPGAKGPPGR